MGYRTPNIDRIAAEGVRFTDYYGEQSCTAGRAAFITGQNPYRTGLSKVGMPGADIGLQAPDPTIATALKAQGYTTGQFGKNHLGDKDEFLPTMHGFDEFFGNLYHLNAEEEPEHDDYPSEEEFPNFRKNFGPRGVIHSWANGDGTQRIEDTGPLTKERMKTVDEEMLPEALRFMGDAKADDTPFFVWFNTTHMHFRTHIKDGSRGKAGRWQSRVPRRDVSTTTNSSARSSTTSTRHGLADDTIVVYSTDNGPHMNTWPDAGMTPFRNEKNSNWEGAYRVPAMVRWPGQHPRRRGAQRHREPQRLVRHVPGGRRRSRHPGRTQGRHRPQRHDYKVHLDGHNQLDYITGAADESPRQHFFYVSDDGDLTALRYDNWKVVFLEQRARARCRCGPSRTPSCACRRSSTCAPTRTSAPTSPRTPTTTGCSIGPGCSCRRRPTWPACSDAGRVPAAPGAGELQHRAGARQAAGRGLRARDRDPGGHVPHGLRRPLSRGGAGASGQRRRLLDQPDHGHQRAVRRVRRGDRLRHGRRASARPG